MTSGVGKINTTTVNNTVYMTSGKIDLKGKFYSPSVSDKPRVAKPQENNPSFLKILGQKFQTEKLAEKLA